MNKIKSALGYLWAVAAIILIPVMFIGLEKFTKSMVEASGIKVSTIFTGGEVLKAYDKNGYKVTVQKAVFPALVGESPTGFTQVSFLADKRESIAGIDENIDYDGDGKNDYNVKIDVKKPEATITPLDESVAGLYKLFTLNKGWGVRVLVKKKS